MGRPGNSYQLSLGTSAEDVPAVTKAISFKPCDLGQVRGVGGGWQRCADWSGARTCQLLLAWGQAAAVPSRPRCPSVWVRCRSPEPSPAPPAWPPHSPSPPRTMHVGGWRRPALDYALILPVAPAPPPFLHPAASLPVPHARVPPPLLTPLHPSFPPLQYLPQPCHLQRHRPRARQRLVDQPPPQQPAPPVPLPARLHARRRAADCAPGGGGEHGRPARWV